MRHYAMDLNKILPHVQKPARYTGGEWNSARPRPDASATICFCFPDLYEIGTSSLGVEVLYNIVNTTGRFAAERCYSPDLDFEEMLIKNNVPLYSLETKKPLKDFDVLGFSIHCELLLANVLAMLSSAGLGIFAAEREGLPLVIGGGPLAVNPEPVADFFDAFVIGDGEEAILEVLEVIAELKKQNDKKRILKELAALGGVYVPSFYEAVYDGGNFAGLKKKESAAPDFVEKRIFDIAGRKRFGETFPVVPNVASVHSRLNIEIARGCPHGCHFCQAKNYYWPWRPRPLEDIKSAVTSGLRNTGYDEVAFTSLSSGDYPGIEKLIAEVIEENKNYPLAVSLPSLHCGNFTVALASSLSLSSSRPPLTFAPEAGSERLRFAIGKPLSDATIFDAIGTAAGNGWKQVKLYFMYGLPGETYDDIKAIVGLVREIRRRHRELNVKVTLSPFVPKPHTVFQRENFAPLEELREKNEYLRKNIRADVKSHRVESSFIEALLARGDRRLSRVIHRAFINGCRFDQWQDRFGFEKWIGAFESCGIEPAFYVNRFSDEKLSLPWEHIRLRGHGLKKSDENARSSEMRSAAVPSSSVAAVSAHAVVRAKSSLRYRIRVARQGLSRFISHNDQIEIFRRASRRAGLPLSYTSGFSPQPKMSFGPAVSVGYESNAEYFEVELDKHKNPEEIRSALAAQMPEGFRVLSVRQIPSVFPSLEVLCNVVDYTAYLDVSPGMKEDIRRFNGAETFIYEKVSSGGMKSEIDLKKLVRRLEVIDENSVFFSENIEPGKTVKPEKILAFLLKIDEREIIIRREKFYTVKRDGSLLEL